eukprot:15455674-Alexandrium_andersonii.AAC.1
MSSAVSECAPAVAQNAPLRELRGSISRPFFGPRSSTSERVKHHCVFGSSDSEGLIFGVNAGV